MKKILSIVFLTVLFGAQFAYSQQSNTNDVVHDTAMSYAIDSVNSRVLVVTEISVKSKLAQREQGTKGQERFKSDITRTSRVVSPYIPELKNLNEQAFKDLYRGEKLFVGLDCVYENFMFKVKRKNLQYDTKNQKVLVTYMNDLSFNVLIAIILSFVFALLIYSIYKIGYDRGSFFDEYNNIKMHDIMGHLLMLLCVSFAGGMVYLFGGITAIAHAALSWYMFVGILLGLLGILLDRLERSKKNA